jgi:hypothetical protein
MMRALGQYLARLHARARKDSAATSTTRSERSFSNAVLTLDSGVTLMAGVVAIRASAGYVRMFGRADADAFRLSLGGGFRF